MKKFDELKKEYDAAHKNDKSVSCFLPVHLTTGKIETSLKKKNGDNNEQYYKWQFLNCFIGAGLCAKDYVGTEVQFPKGNKSSAMIKLDGAIFDDKTSAHPPDQSQESFQVPSSRSLQLIFL